VLPSIKKLSRTFYAKEIRHKTSSNMRIILTLGIKLKYKLGWCSVLGYWTDAGMEGKVSVLSVWGQRVATVHLFFESSFAYQHMPFQNTI
jgi:hypothetical protein